jgi:hypothetical protein
MSLLKALIKVKSSNTLSLKSTMSLSRQPQWTTLAASSRTHFFKLSIGKNGTGKLHLYESFPNLDWIMAPRRSLCRAFWTKELPTEAMSTASTVAESAVFFLTAAQPDIIFRVLLNLEVFSVDCILTSSLAIFSDSVWMNFAWSMQTKTLVVAL